MTPGEKGNAGETKVEVEERTQQIDRLTDEKHDGIQRSKENIHQQHNNHFHMPMTQCRNKKKSHPPGKRQGAITLISGLRP
jgi:hypothetical protein